MADVITGLIGPEVVLGLEVFHGMKYFVIVLGGDTLVDPRHPFSMVDVLIAGSIGPELVSELRYFSGPKGDCHHQRR